jgi:DNA-binding NtrC family response regulator
MPLAVIVEDEWAIRMQVADTFTDAGWEVIEFASGELALEFLKQNSREIVLVTDIRLGTDVTGWDVAEAYRAADARTKVIYCSGNPVVEARKVANSVFFSKPCQMEMILDAATA